MSTKQQRKEAIQLVKSVHHATEKVLWKLSFSNEFKALEIAEKARDQMDELCKILQVREGFMLVLIA